MDNQTVELHNQRYEITDGQLIVYGPTGNELSRHPIEELGFSEGENAISSHEMLYEFTIIFPDGLTVNFRDKPDLDAFAEAFKREKGAL